MGGINLDTLLGCEQIKPNSLNPISLAYIGDAVYEILVREYLVLEGNRPPEELHKLAVSFVSAKAQAAAIERIAPMLTEEETCAFKRGRNAKVSHVPKGASVAHYHNATGFEALFGHLYLTNQTERMRELFKFICEGEIIEQEK
ncbi:MAG: ribonuclease III [Clostridia bacterium]|nr:ribonuclease III [Clostridia bacterium]